MFPITFPRSKKSAQPDDESATLLETTAEPTSRASVVSTDAPVTDNVTPGSSVKKASQVELKARLADTEISLAGLKVQVKDEKAAKRKLYASLVKLAQEFKRLRTEVQPLKDAMDYANRPWYEGGMWRHPSILPGAASQQVKSILREATGLSGYFFNLVIVTAFSRVGISIAENRSLSVDSLLYFAVFWMIWTKDLAYCTRFDFTDLSFELVNLLTCIAVLFGSLSTSAEIDTEGGMCVMIMAAFVAILHSLLHLRLALWFRRAAQDSIEHVAYRHAVFSSLMTLCEAATWTVGIAMSEIPGTRWIIFVIGLAFSCARLPNTFQSDFNAATTKRSLLFVLLIGFLFQSVVVVASPFFEYQSPTTEQYGFLGACGLMLYCLKLLYENDAPKLAQDHALLVSGASAFLFNVGHFCLLLGTTVLGSGLDLLTHNYLAATTALPHNAREMVCGGFAAVIFSILFIKAMHLKRIPVFGMPRFIFVATLFTQMLVYLAVVTVSTCLCLGAQFFGVLLQDGITLILGLAGVSFFLVLLSWTDEAVELALYSGDDSDSSQELVHPFGFWWCVARETITKQTSEDDSVDLVAKGPSVLSSMTPLLGSVANMQMSTRGYEAFSSGGV
ncbi:Bacterial low temperature requirement A protein (LtrA) [Fragilaria crotonensis]|nr:Bacterial low temperature requirement A protein (LtrA) [Fragilaria crotonensis]